MLRRPTGDGGPGLPPGSGRVPSSIDGEDSSQPALADVSANKEQGNHSGSAAAVDELDKRSVTEGSIGSSVLPSMARSRTDSLSQAVLLEQSADYPQLFRVFTAPSETMNTNATSNDEYNMNSKQGRSKTSGKRSSTRLTSPTDMAGEGGRTQKSRSASAVSTAASSSSGRRGGMKTREAEAAAVAAALTRTAKKRSRLSEHVDAQKRLQLEDERRGGGSASQPASRTASASTYGSGSRRSSQSRSGSESNLMERAFRASITDSGRPQRKQSPRSSSAHRQYDVVSDKGSRRRRESTMSSRGGGAGSGQRTDDSVSAGSPSERRHHKHEEKVPVRTPSMYYALSETSSRQRADEQWDPLVGLPMYSLSRSHSHTSLRGSRRGDDLAERERRPSRGHGPGSSHGSTSMRSGRENGTSAKVERTASTPASFHDADRKRWRHLSHSQPVDNPRSHSRNGEDEDHEDNDWNSSVPARGRHHERGGSYSTSEEAPHRTAASRGRRGSRDRGDLKKQRRKEEREAAREKKRRRRERRKARRRAERSADSWFHQLIPLSFVMAYLKRQSYRTHLLREFVLFVVVFILFCFYTEFHSTAIERGFFASLAIRQQYGRLEYPTAGRQVDVFRQQSQNGFDLFLPLDTFFHDISTPLDFLDFVRDVLVGSGNPLTEVSVNASSSAIAKSQRAGTVRDSGASSNSNDSGSDNGSRGGGGGAGGGKGDGIGSGSGSGSNTDDGSSEDEAWFDWGTVLGDTQRTSRSSIRAFTERGGSPFRAESRAALTNSDSVVGPFQPHRGHYFAGALRLRTLRVRNGTGNLQRGLYTQPASSGSPFPFVPRDHYASGHDERDEDVSQLCPNIMHPFLERVVGGGGSAATADNETEASEDGHVHLYRYLPCDSVAYRAGGIKGIYGTYHCGGHVVDLPFSYTIDQAQLVVRAMSLPSCRFLDNQATRLAVAEFFVYLPSYDHWLSVRFRTEVSVTGLFDNIMTVRVFRVYTDHKGKGQLILTCFTVVFVLIYLLFFIHKVEMLLRKDNLAASRMLLHGPAHTGWRPIFRYLTTAWPYLDVTFVTAAAVSFGFYFRWLQVSKHELPAIRASLAGITPTSGSATSSVYPEMLNEIQYLYESGHIAAVIAIGLLFVRMVYFCHFFAVARVLMIDMVGVCAPQVLGIGFGLLLALVGYALAGWSVFGESTEGFSSIGKSMATLLQLLTGDDDYVPSAVVQRLTTNDSQLNEHFVFFYFWSYFAMVYSIAVSLFLSLTSLTYQELTLKTFMISTDMEYFAREMKVWRARLSWTSLKRTLGGIFGFGNSVKCNELLLAALRRTREEREMQRVMTLVETKLEQLQMESTAAAAGSQRYSHRTGKSSQADDNGAEVTASGTSLSATQLMNLMAGKGGGSAAKVEAVLGQSSNSADPSVGTTTSSGTDAVLDSLGVLLPGSVGKIKAGATTTSSSMTSDLATINAAVFSSSAGAATGSGRGKKTGFHQLSSEDIESAAHLRRVLEGNFTAEELRKILTADLISKARAKGSSGRRRMTRATGCSESDTDDDDDDYVLAPDESNSLTYFTLTDIVPAQLFTMCGGEPFFQKLWIDVYADYAEMMSTTAAIEKRSFMQAVGNVTQAKVGSQLTRVEQLDATITQLEEHMASIMANLKDFSRVMAATGNNEGNYT